MPRRDGTGPIEEVSKIGKAVGAYDENKITGDVRSIGCGLGLGCRRGFGRGFGKSFVRNKFDYENKKDLLMQEKAIIENRLSIINKELDMMEKDKEIEH